MGVAALLAPVAIPSSLFNHPRLASPGYDAAFNALAEVSLITPGEDAAGQSTVTVHRLVQAVNLDRIAETGHLPQLTELAVELLVTAIPNRVRQTTPPGRSANPSPLMRWRFSKQPFETAGGKGRAALLAFNVAKYFKYISRATEAEHWAHYAKDNWERTLGPEHGNVVNSLYVLAWIAESRGSYKEAAQLFERILRKTKASAGQSTLRRHPR